MKREISHKENRMKLTKFLAGAAALMMAFTVAGCKLADEEGAFDGKTVNYNNSKVIITEKDGVTTVTKGTDDANKALEGAVDNSSWYYRALKSLATKHYDSVCTINITPNDKTAGDGVAGYIFGQEKNKDSTYNFGIVALRYYANKVQTYISYYKNVSVKDNNYTEAKNFTDINGVTIGDKGCLATETQIIPSTGSFVDLTDYTLGTDGVLSVVVSVKAKDTGKYDVSYYKISDLEGGKIKTGSRAVKTVEDVDCGFTQKTQADLAMYVNIYPGKTMNTTFNFTDTNGQAIPFEEDL